MLYNNLSNNKFLFSNLLEYETKKNHNISYEDFYLSRNKSLVNKQYLSKRIINPYNILLNEMRRVVKYYGFESVKFKKESDYGLIKRIYIIKRPANNALKDIFNNYEEFIKHMENFSKKNNIYDLFLDTYTLME